MHTFLHRWTCLASGIVVTIHCHLTGICETPVSIFIILVQCNVSMNFSKYFYASVPKVPEAFMIMFSGCPSGFFRLRDNSSITWWNFIKLGQKVKLDVTINWLDFEWDCLAGGANVGQPPPPPPWLDFFVYAITQVLLDGISSNLVRRSSWMWQLTD